MMDMHIEVDIGIRTQRATRGVAFDQAQFGQLCQQAPMLASSPTSGGRGAHTLGNGMGRRVTSTPEPETV